MPFTPKSEVVLGAMSMDQLETYLGVIERLFTAVRRRYGRLRTTGGCPQDWRDLVAEIDNTKQVIIMKTLLEFRVEDPCADPN